MRIPRIYSSQSLTAGNTIELETQASLHIAKVLRMQVGDQITLFNGDGNNYPSVIEAISKKHCLLSVTDCENACTESTLTTHLGLVISKGDRVDWAVQKATELGVTTITPLVSDRATLKLTGERAEKKSQHWQKIAIAACEQCGRSTVPTVDSVIPLQQWIKLVEGDRKWVLHHRSDQQAPFQDKINSAALLIGPEGGLTAEEIQLAVASGFDELTLGPRVLRTETAPVVALSLLQYFHGDLS